MLKRKPSEILQRRVRARREESEDLESIQSDNSSSSEHENQDKSQDSQSDNSDDDSSESSEDEGLNAAAEISFGALAKAQASLSAPSKRSSKAALKSTESDVWGEDNEAAERKAGRKDTRDFNRSSKHAPTEISSKKAVSRKREVVPVPKKLVRDPRFENIDGGAVDEERVRKAYSFLDEYREDEMKELRDTIKKTKDENVKERLKRKLLSMESKKKAQARKDKEAEVLERHRKEEKELVKAGKQPFYLKRSEQKKQVLMETYAGLKGKQLDHVIERRRKKVEGKEKKKLPFARRGAE